MDDDTLAADGLAFATDVADDVFVTRLGRIANDGVRDLCVVEDSVAFAIEGTFEREGCGAVAKEDEAALCACEAQSVLDHGAKDVLQYAGVVEALCRLEKEGELFELGAGGLGRDTVEEGSSRDLIVLGDEEESDTRGAQLDAITGAKVDFFGQSVVYKGSVTASEVLNREPILVLVDNGMLAGDLRIGETQIAVDVAANCKRKTVEGYSLGLVRFADDQTGCILDGLHRFTGSIGHPGLSRSVCLNEN